MADFKKYWTEKLMVPLYQEKYIQTLWNAEKEKNRKGGWTVVSGAKVPWYFNMRPLGDSPALFHDVCQANAEMIAPYGLDLIIGVEMAGVPLVGGVAMAMFGLGKPQRFGYTRPTPVKGARPADVPSLLKGIETGAFAYGEKSFVEARMEDGDRIAIFDDMATTLGSKIVARSLVLWQSKQLGLKVSCNQVFYTLNRGKGNRDAGRSLADETEPALYPAALDVDYIIEFDDAMPLLKGVMKPGEYATTRAFQDDPKNFDMERAVAMAARGE